MSNKKGTLRADKQFPGYAKLLVYKAKILSILTVGADVLLQRLFPVKCVGCGKERTYLCFQCAQEIDLIQTDTCPKCGKISPKSRICTSCKIGQKYYLNAVFIGSRYDVGPAKEMLYMLKYQGVTALAELLAAIAALRVKNVIRPETIVVPVPISANRLRRRGYNQAELLARKISEILGLSGGNALNRIRETRSQVGLTKQERADNVKDSFCCVDRELISGREVLLVDDIATTYATLNECAKVLREAGAKKVIGLVVAKRI